MNSDFFISNRRRLIEAVPGKLIVIAGWTGMQWHGDSAVPFRQEANFWYLTGIDQADWRLIIDGRQHMSWLVAPNIDEVQQLFDGSLGADDAKAVSGVDAVLSADRGKAKLVELSKKYDEVCTFYGSQDTSFAPNPAPKILQKELKKLFLSVVDCQKEVAKLRAIKQPQEIDAMRRAADITAEALQRTKAKLAMCEHEYEVEAELVCHFRRYNADHAFEPIVASGKNACTLHYTANASRLCQSDMLLIDTGARVSSYAADITRTYALGEVSERQRQIHQAVQLAEQRIIELIRPGFALEVYLQSVDEIMKDTLLSVGLMKNKKDTESYRRYFPHAISHGLGIDVHESLGGYKEFQPGMVLSIEPGIYIPGEGVGVRIEDAVLVTDKGAQNLTGDLSTDL